MTSARRRRSPRRRSISTPSLSGEAVLRRVGRASLDHLLRNEDAALAGDAEGLHQMRVAVRRLRAILSAFTPMLPNAQGRWVSQELRWFGDVLGEARNLDVFASALVAPARVALPDASEFERLAQAADRQRRKAHAAVAARCPISSTRHYTGALLALLRWLDGGDWHLAAAETLHAPIGSLAPAMLDRCRATAEKRAKNFSRQSPKKRHRLRIALKKLRYTAELFAPLYAGPEMKQFIQRLKRLQDDLGDANDVRVGRDIVAALAPDRRSTGIAHAGRRLLAWHKRRIAKNEPQLRRLPSGWNCSPHGPFWQA